MKNSLWFKFLSVLTVFVLLIAVVVVLSPNRPAQAQTGTETTEDLKKPVTQATDKVIVNNLTLPNIVAAFEGTADPSGAMPAGVFESAVRAPAVSGPIEIFVPVGKTSTLYIFTPTGYHFLQEVMPTGSQPSIQVDASKYMTASVAVTSTNPAKAEPTTESK
jgi:hypothetical protein